jgi:predicted nucleotidyltransferase
VQKFFGLLLKKNGYVLEQLFSPLIVHTTPEHAELKAICNPRQFVRSPGTRSGSRKLTIPELSFVVLTGVSGSGKGTFA